jgi:hypothetical protein
VSERAVHGQDRDAADIILEPGTRDTEKEKKQEKQDREKGEEEGGDSQQDQKEKMRQLFR